MQSFDGEICWKDWETREESEVKQQMRMSSGGSSPSDVSRQARWPELAAASSEMRQ
jgi:hypothetical protein